MLREGVFVTSVGTQSAAQMFVFADHLLVRVFHFFLWQHHCSPL